MLAFCVSNGIRVFSSCGSACKSDPTRVRISPLGEVTEDELGRAVRSKLKKKSDDINSVMCVFSTEKSSMGLLPLKDFQESNPKEYQTLDKFRIRILPVIAPMPTIFGNSIASYILCELSSKPFSALTRDSLTKSQWRKLQENLKAFERNQKVLDKIATLEICEEIFLRVCKCKSLISGKSSNLAVVPWKFQSLSVGDLVVPDNLILMTGKEGKDHLENGGTYEKNLILYGSAKCLEVDKQLNPVSK